MCITAGQQVLGACQQALTAMAPIYPPTSPEPANDSQFGDSVVALKIAQQPTEA